MAEKLVLDRHRNKIEVGMKLRVCHCTGSYGVVTIDEGIVLEIDVYTGVYLELLKPTRWVSRDGVKNLKAGDRYYIPLPGEWDTPLGAYVCEKVHHDVEHGHQAWAEIMDS